MLHSLTLVAALLVPAGPCACTPGEFCTWVGTRYTSSHLEDPAPGSFARSMLNKTPDSLDIHGTVGRLPRTYCLNPGEGQSDTGAFTLDRVVVRDVPCEIL
ncbi:hypothetical protein [Nonomuraea sp. NPDC050310]|uniref:hypothetical protein n=1 Tax=unclassified Nonomuraea TaxID=2593643 RepID=UPI00340E133D